MDWNWNFRAFRLFGVDVNIHWSLPAYLLYYIVRAAQLGYSSQTLTLFVILPMGLLFASVIAHEYGHVFAARARRLTTGNMILTPIGGMVMVAQGRTPSDERFIAAAGPFVNLALAILATGLYFAIGGTYGLEMFLPFVGDEMFKEMWAAQRITQMVIFDFVQTQIALFLFNMLLVAYPMDGGRVLMSFLWKKRGFHGGLALSCKIARVLAVLIAIAGLVTLRPVMVVIAFFVFIQAQSTLARVNMLPDPGGYYAVRPQAKKKPKPWFFKTWLLARKEKKVRALLARAETRGIDSLTKSEREWLRRARGPE